jgi:hypothetical protein
VGDLDGDGIADLVVLDEGVYNPETYERGPVGVRTFRGGGEGSFADWHFYDFGVEDFSCLSRGDIDEDGMLDLVTGNPSTDELLLLMGTGDGLFVEKTVGVEEGIVSCSLGDYDGDAHLDLVVSVSRYNDERDNFGDVVFFKGNGVGDLVKVDEINVYENPFPWLFPYTVPVFADGPVDMDGNGIDDAIASSEQGVYIFRIDETTGKFRLPELFNAGGFVYGLSAADFDGDGDLDIAAVGDRIQVRILMNGLGACVE